MTGACTPSPPNSVWPPPCRTDRHWLVRIGGEDSGIAGCSSSGSPTRRRALPSASNISRLAKGAEVIEPMVNWGCTSSSRCAINLASSMRPRLASAAARIQ